MNNEQELINQAIELAKSWQNRAQELVCNKDREFYEKMNNLLEHPKDKALLIELLDQSFRSSSNARIANQIIFLLKKYKMAHFFSTKDKILLWLFQNIGKYFSDISVPLFVKQIREDTKTVIIKGEEEFFNEHLQKRKKEGTRVNINLIGEAVLGENEAQLRIQKYLTALENPNIDYVSIKISTLYSQINVLDFDNTVNILVEKLTQIYSCAQKHQYINEDGLKQNKFINFDMEEYQDLATTVAVFKKTLSKQQFKNFYAGIALQAYLPDSFSILQDLTKWAKKRVEDGGSAIKIRLVKGANMEMEATQASQRNWEIVTYTCKSDTDAHYKKMARFSLQKEHAPYVHIGVASHNLFELSYATVLAQANAVDKYLTLEMLEGMSEAARLAIKEISKEVILYAPIAQKEQFTNAIAYLVRRLDENTGVDNFIRYSFGLKVGSEDWNRQKELFLKSFENEENLFTGSKRSQNRVDEKWDNYVQSSYDTGVYTAQADTDFILAQNQIWANSIVQKWKFDKETLHETVPIVVDGRDIVEQRVESWVIDKSQLEEGVFAGKFAKANASDIEKAIQSARNDVDGWRCKTHRQRHEILKQVGIKIRERRGDLIGIAAAEVGKIFTETDVEVSEAIDFIEFYTHSIEFFDKYENLEFKGKGVGVVTPPWNFPIAIPAGGIAAALACGNSVILKPASTATLCAYLLCKCFWDAGVSKKTLQFVPCSGELAGKYLISNEDIDFVILTGGEDTAHKMLKTRPNLFLTAETGGKDATIVTNMADRDQAVKNVCQSAFSNAGQKCSSTSLLVLEDEVYEDIGFKNALIDAANSLRVGSVWDLGNKIGPLANKVSAKLEKAMTVLEDNEQWALKPIFVNDNPFMLKPSIKWGVKEGSYCHKTELFGPVLSVMKANDLRHAIKIVNDTGYGLTSAIESLDEREVEQWRKNLKAGNLYINRGTTGAIVLRQPFGGMGKSAIGAGRKAGFFNYVTQFVDFKEIRTPKIVKKYDNELISFISNCKTKNHKSENLKKLEQALQSYIHNYKNEFGVEKEYITVRGEDNIFKYVPVHNVLIRVEAFDSLFEIVSRILAARVCKVNFTVSINKNEIIKQFLNNSKELFGLNDKMIEQDDISFCKIIKDFKRVIYSNINKVPKIVFEEASKTATFITRQKPMMEGRCELLNYFEEQSISHSYHRYGNLGIRAVKQ